MNRLQPLIVFLKSAGLMVSTTLGAGMFALPYIVQRSGWGTALIYLALMAALISYVHHTYLNVLHKENEKLRLLGLVRAYWGEAGFFGAFLVIAIGLVLTLAAYLVLGVEFASFIWPQISPRNALVLFWMAGIAPFVLQTRKLVGAELVAAVAMIGIIAVVVATADNVDSIRLNFSLADDAKAWFLPFGAILFSLAGWTAIEPIYEITQDKKMMSPMRWGMVIGTFFSAAVYIFFIWGILAGGKHIGVEVMDIVLGWPTWKAQTLGVLGISLLLTSFWPIALEVKNSLEKDLFWPHWRSSFFVLILPLALVLAGLNSFLELVEFVGGVFAAAQYVLILLVAAKIFKRTSASGWIRYGLHLVFAVGIVYTVLRFFGFFD